MKSIKRSLSAKPAIISGILTLIIALSFNTGSTAQAQTPYKIIEASQIKVLGTSNLHDWVMTAKSFTCEGGFVLKGDQLADVTTLNLSIPIRNLKSKETTMDNRAYKTLNADKFNNIVFKLTAATVNQQQKTIKASGNLTISGVTNPITLQISYVVSGNEITCKGTQAIKMSEYKIKAPSFMLGALKTGDDLTIEILLKMKK